MTDAISWCIDNQTLIATVFFVISEALGVNPKVKSNGIISFILLQVRGYLRTKSSKDLKF